MTIEALKQAIAELPEEEKTALATTSKRWRGGTDRCRRNFRRGGRGMRVVEKVKSDTRAASSRRWINRSQLPGGSVRLRAGIGQHSAETSGRRTLRSSPHR